MFFHYDYSQKDKVLFYMYLSLFLFLFTSLATASAEQQPVEIPFSLISSDRTQGTPGEPGQLASLWAVAAVCLAPGPRCRLSLSSPHNPSELWIYRAMHFYICHKCHGLPLPEQVKAPVLVTVRNAL